MKAIGLVLVAAGMAAAVLVYQRYTPARRGERAFQQLGCSGCHFSGAGPNLTHAAHRRDREFLERFIANPPEVYGERGMRSLNDGYTLMPDIHASVANAKAITAYLVELDKQ